MSYRKFEVDNIVCSRRFHIVYDDEAPAVARTQVTCEFCNMTVFEAENHPPVRLAREENLVQTGTLSDKLLRECHMVDEFSAKTRHEPRKEIYSPTDKPKP